MLNVRANTGEDFAATFRKENAQTASPPPASAVDQLVGQIHTASSPVERAQLLAQLDTHTGSSQASDALVRDAATSAGGPSAVAAQASVGNGAATASARSAAYERVSVNASPQPGATEGGPDQTDEPGMLFQPGESANAFAGIGKINYPDGSSGGIFSDFGGSAATATAQAAPPANEAAAPADPGTPAVAPTEAAPASPDTAASTAPETTPAADPVPTPPDTAASPSTLPATPASTSGAGGPPTTIATSTENGSVIYYPQNSPTIDNKALWYASANADYVGPVYTPSADDGKTGVGPATGGELDNGPGANVVYQQGAPDVHYDAQNAPYVYAPRADGTGLYAVYIYPSAPSPSTQPVTLPDNFMINSNYLANTFPANGSQFTLTNNTDGVRDYPAGYQIPGQTYIRGPLTADEQNNLAVLRNQGDRIGLAASNPFAASALLAGSSTSTAATVGAVADIALTGAVGAVGANRAVNTGEVAAAPQVQINKALGDAFEADVLNNVLPRTQANIQPQITVLTNGPSGLKVRLDAIGVNSTTGDIVLTDAKSSPTASLTANQTIVYPELQTYGGTVVGQGKAPYVGGTPIPPSNVQIVRRPQP